MTLHVLAFGRRLICATGLALGIDVTQLPQVMVDPVAANGGVFADANSEIWVCATCITPDLPLNFDLSVNLPAGASNLPGAIAWQPPAQPMGIFNRDIVISNLGSSTLTALVRFPIAARSSISFPDHGFGSITAGVSYDFVALSPGGRYQIRPTTGGVWALVRQ